MKYYIQFYNEQKKFDINTMQWLDEIVIREAIGSEGVYILDGRNNLNTMINDGYERMAKLEGVHNYCGFKVMRGDFKNSTPIHSTI